ncbi:MAG: hypothetical protein J7456_13120, partial [Chloroflexus sp.]|nr:hypothetical protein [Chloroflexus sp.]
MSAGFTTRRQHMRSTLGGHQITLLPQRGRGAGGEGRPQRESGAGGEGCPLGSRNVWRMAEQNVGPHAVVADA